MLLRLYGRHLEGPDSWTTGIDRDIGVRIYSDTRPHNLDGAPLQKGLILLLEEKELIEEGMGFGAPVVDYADRTFFSSDAQTVVSDEGQEKIVMKTFKLNSVLRKQLSSGPYIESVLYNPIARRLIDRYRGGGMEPQFKFIMSLINMLNIHTRFQKTKARGDIILTYRIRHRTINIEVNLTGLHRNGCRNIIILNEQGSAFFTRYQDGSGLILRDNQIGPWEKIRAPHASFSDTDGNLMFELENSGDAELFRGREMVRGRLAWAGLDYILDPSTDRFWYSIKLGGRFLDRPAAHLSIL